MVEDKDSPLAKLPGARATLEQIAELPTVYVSNIELSFTPFDARMILSETVGRDGERMLIKRHLKMVMSLEHAKAFSQLLTAGIERFEKAAHQEIPHFQFSEDEEETA